MYEYKFVRKEIFPGNIKDFRALMYEFSLLQPKDQPDQIILQGERPLSDGPQNIARWEFTLGPTLTQRGYILARQLPDGTTNLQFAYYSKFKPIGWQFDVEYADKVVSHWSTLNKATHRQGSTGHSAKAIILTAIPIEYKAVRAHLINLREVVHPMGTVYEQGTFSSSITMWEVGVVEIGSGNAHAALEAERAIQFFEPDVVLFVGIAGGIKDVVLGDIVAATKVYGYESGKDEETFRSRPTIANSTYRMEQRARAEAKKDNWLQRIKDIHFTSNPRVFVGPMAAGDKVVASTKSATYRFLRLHYSDALAIEMEGYGFLESAHANPGVEALVIRGISDLIDGKGETDASGLQEIAASNASAFAFQILANIAIHNESPENDQKDTAQLNVSTDIDFSPPTSADERAGARRRLVHEIEN